MTLSPEDVEQQVFRERRRGYDPEEVDQFLDQVSSALGDLLRERDAANAKLAETENGGTASRENEDLLRRALISAERTAHQRIAEASEEADQIREDARRYAAELRETAESEAAELREAAARDAAELRESVEAEVSQERALARVGADRVRRAVAELQSFRDDYRERVQGVIAEQLAALDRVGDLPDIEPAFDQVAKLPSDDDGRNAPAAHEQ